MKLEILGTRVAALGGGCSAYLVHAAEGTIMLDCGTGAFERLWNSGAMPDLDAIVISHMHHDHMIDILPFTSGIAQRAIAKVRPSSRGKIVLYVPRTRGPEVIRSLADVVSNAHTIAGITANGLASTRLSQVFDIREYDATSVIHHSGLTVTFVETDHSELCFAPRIDDDTSTIVYTADAAFTHVLVQHCQGADLLLADATFLLEDAETSARGGHMNVTQAAELADLAGVGELVLTHFIPNDIDDDERHRRAQSAFGGRVSLASEGAVYRLGS